MFPSRGGVQCILLLWLVRKLQYQKSKQCGFRGVGARSWGHCEVWRDWQVTLGGEIKEDFWTQKAGKDPENQSPQRQTKEEKLRSPGREENCFKIEKGRGSENDKILKKHDKIFLILKVLIDISQGGLIVDSTEWLFLIWRIYLCREKWPESPFHCCRIYDGGDSCILGDNRIQRVVRKKRILGRKIQKLWSFYVPDTAHTSLLSIDLRICHLVCFHGFIIHLCLKKKKKTRRNRDWTLPAHALHKYKLIGERMHKINIWTKSF